MEYALIAIVVSVVLNLVRKAKAKPYMVHFSVLMPAIGYFGCIVFVGITVWVWATEGLQGPRIGSLGSALALLGFAAACAVFGVVAGRWRITYNEETFTFRGCFGKPVTYRYEEITNIIFDDFKAVTVWMGETSIRMPSEAAGRYEFAAYAKERYTAITGKTEFPGVKCVD